MPVDVKIDPASLKAVQSSLVKLGKGGVAGAIAKALNDTGFRVRRAMVAELSTRFDNPTPFISRSPKVVMATAEKLSVNIIPTRDTRVKPGTGKVDQQQVLQAQEFGGQRRDKGSELFFRQAGLLKAGQQSMVPEVPLPGTTDERGNLKGSFMKKLMAYLSRSATGKASKVKGFSSYSNLRTRRTVQLLDGYEFFASAGLGAGGRGLHPGIWARDSEGRVRPAIIFGRRGNYTPLISMDRVAKESGAEEYLNRRVRFRVRQAAEALSL